jgi:hypothetical protein
MPGKYPKEHTQDSEYGENLKSRAHFICQWVTIQQIL